MDAGSECWMLAMRNIPVACLPEMPEHATVMLRKDPSMQDSITKSLHLAAPPDRVWRALSDAAEFGTWFRAKVTGEMRAGAVLACRSLYPGTEHMRWQMRILAMEPGRRLVWEWPAFDPAAFPGDPDSDAPLTVEDAHADGVPAGCDT
jgi:uncharacterized protein YndB with AHSA1/START domain